MDLIIANCCYSTDLSVQMDSTILSVIIIDLESRYVYALWLSNLRRLFFTVSTNVYHMKNYHRLSLTCSYRLMTSYICMDIINLVRSLSAILCRDNIVMFRLESLSVIITFNVGLYFSDRKQLHILA